MITHRLARSAVRGSAAALALTLIGLAGPALAWTPSDWADTPAVSGLDFLVVLFLIPFGLAVVIALLAALPSMIRGNKYTPGEEWVNEDQWFGGPRRGAAAEVADAHPADKGGASAGW